MDILTRMKNRRERKKEYSFFDYTLLVVVIFLLGFGLIMIFSASSYEAQLSYGDSAFYFKKQLISSIAGIIGLFIVSWIPFKLYKKVHWGFFVAVGVIVMLLLLVPGISHSANGATRWIKLFGSFTIQPAEIVKICTIILYAKILEEHEFLSKKWSGIVCLAVTALIFAALIYIISDNLSSAIIVCGISFCMCLVACNDKKKLLILSGTGIAFVTAAVLLIIRFGENSDSFRIRRVLAWIHPENYSDETAYQTKQALYAIGSGGMFGKGLGQSMQKLSYIPEAQNDMIFSIICEELGVLGGICVLVLFLILLYRMLLIATNTENTFGMLIVIGVMSHFAIQVLLNIAVVTNTVPNTGVTLPFISYGGSSVVFLLVEIGMVLNVGRSIKFKSPKND